MKYLLLIATACIIAGCQSSKSVDDAATTTVGTSEEASLSGLDGVYSGGGSYDPGAASGYNAATNANHFDNPNYGKGVVGGPQAPAKDRVIYFSYDSSKIDSRAEPIISANAAYLKQHPSARILLEGHTDSRGSREYNIALGERRAISVLKRFQALGVPASQIRIISYGEENPAVSGYNEDSYRRNRRAVIQY